MRFTLSIRPSAPLLHFDSLSSFLAFWFLRCFLPFVRCFHSFVSFVRRFSSLFIPSLTTPFVSFLFRFSFVAPLSQLPTGPVSLSTLSSPPCFLLIVLCSFLCFYYLHPPATFPSGRNISATRHRYRFHRDDPPSPFFVIDWLAFPAVCLPGNVVLSRNWLCLIGRIRVGSFQGIFVIPSIRFRYVKDEGICLGYFESHAVSGDF